MPLFFISLASNCLMNEETKVIYYVDEEETPYLVKLTSPADSVTLGDFKNALNKPNCKFFFKSVDDDFGLVILSSCSSIVIVCHVRFCLLENLKVVIIYRSVSQVYCRLLWSSNCAAVSIFPSYAKL